MCESEMFLFIFTTCWVPPSLVRWGNCRIDSVSVVTLYVCQALEFFLNKENKQFRKFLRKKQLRRQRCPTCCSRT